jgi:hypothetical protein
MAVKKFFLYGLLALLVSGCASGYSVTETLHVQDTPSANVCATDKTVVLLPFADYSSGDDFVSVYTKSRNVTEALTDRFVMKGFKMPVQEDVTRYLVDTNIIQLASVDTTARLQQEMEGEWSNTMKGEFQKWMDADRIMNSAKSGGADHPENAPGVHGLDKRMISKLGRKFNADYVVRGRIIEYNLQKEHTWEMQKMGFIPFVIKGSTQAAFGFAESEYYDNLNSITLWGLAGAIIGKEVEYPVDVGTATLNAGDHANAWNAVLWGFGGAGMAHLANHSGEMPEAIVHLRIWVQDTETGEVVWTNRAEIKVAPQTIYGDNRSNEMFKMAVNKATTLLVDDFWDKTKAIM